MTTDIVALIANISLALSFIVAVIFGITQVKVAARDRKERLTLETLRNYQSAEFSEMIFKVLQFEVSTTYEEWRKLPDSDQVMFIQFTQQMEALGLLVAEHYIDIDLVDKTLGVFVSNSWDKMKAVIIDMRTNQPDPFLCEYFQWLAERMKERMSKVPRKPYYLMK